jgi:hypothetical protein
MWLCCRAAGVPPLWTVEDSLHVFHLWAFASTAASEVRAICLY